MKILSKVEALTQGLPKYFTGKPCSSGHVDERYVSSRACVTCTQNRRLKSYIENKELCNQQSKDWYLKNYEKHNEKNKSWQKLNPDKVKVINKNWVINNRDVANARTNNRRAAKLQRTPGWADKKEILKFYTESSRLTKETGIEYQVDHIVPLRGDSVCGLHVHYNLQIISKSENYKKSNIFESDWEYI
jgi:hypothetical protein